MSTILEKAYENQGRNESVHYFRLTILIIGYNDHWSFPLPQMTTLVGPDVMLATKSIQRN